MHTLPFFKAWHQHPPWGYEHQQKCTWTGYIDKVKLYGTAYVLRVMWSHLLWYWNVTGCGVVQYTCGHRHRTTTWCYFHCMKMDGLWAKNWLRQWRESEPVSLLLKGCSCRSGCETKWCGCRQKRITCGPGCHCTTCHNTQNNQANPEFVDIIEQTLDGSTVPDVLKESADEIHQSCTTLCSYIERSGLVFWSSMLNSLGDAVWNTLTLTLF